MILSTYAENNLLNLIFGATAWAAKPGTLYYALLTTAPTDAGGGTEVSAAGYTRHAATVGGSYFEVATTNGAPVTNKLAVSFGTATAAWGTVVAWGLYDASAGGNLIAWGAIPPTIVGVNYTPSWAIGAFSFDVTGGFGDWLGKSILNYLFIGTTFPTVAKHYFALGTSASEAGIVSEPAIGTYAYARKAMDNLVATWAAASAGAKSNAAAITFAASTGTAWGSMSHFAILSSGGIALTFTVVNATNVLTTSANHNLAIGDIIQVAGSDLALNLVANTNYYVLTIPSATTLTLSETAGGATFDMADDGTGTQTLYPQTIWHGALEAVVGSDVGDAPSFAAGALDIDLD